MPLNDDVDNEFSSKLEDETVYPPQPTYADGSNKLRRDCGSGSYAEDGPLEVAEDFVMMNGETSVGGYEIGDDEIGSHYPTEGASELGSYAMYGPSEIGSHYPTEGASEIGHYPTQGASEIGSYAMYGPSEIGAGHFPTDGASEIGGGHAASEGQSEIGRAADIMAPFESFMLDDTRMGSYAMYGPTEIGQYAEHGASEIGAAQAVARVIEKARDNRQPAPPMRAVDVDAPVRDSDEDYDLADTCVGAAQATGTDPFPLLSQLLVRAGATTEPRIVRVDTEESYKGFRTAHSPELSALAEKLEAHIADPHAHGLTGSVSDVSDDVDELVMLGEEAQAVEAAKRVDLWMPKRFDGKVEAWREGEFVCVSMALPGGDGQVRICTSLEPIQKCVEEMSRHAAESGVPASTVVGVLPAMGCVLGAGTVMKEMAAAAPAILQRPEAAGNQPFEVRIEPKTSPALAALAMLAWAAKQGNTQAGDEWSKLSAVCAGPVKQAMAEALQIVKAAA